MNYQLKRIGRHLLWPHPLLYCLFGIAKHGIGWSVFERNHQVYICGYPRSGNTFTVKAFSLANPEVLIRSHRHIPTFLVVSAKRNTPGITLIRNPLDAAISWAIYMNKPLHRALQYYEDYYSVLLPYREQLFIVRFQDVINDFGQVMCAFNARWGTSYKCFVNSPENIALCMSKIEDDFRRSDGSIEETRVARPSQERNAKKQELIDELTSSSLTKEALRRAVRPYDFLSEVAHNNIPKT